MNDEELLDHLALVFAPEIGAGSQPSPQAMAALHRALAERSERALRSGVQRNPAHRLWLVALGGVAASLGATTAAFAAGLPLPDPLRALAHNVGLPVDSTTLVNAKSKRAELEAAVSRQDAAEAARLARALRDDLADLDDDERRQVEPSAIALLERADNLTGQSATGPTGTQPQGTQPQGTQQQGSPQQGSQSTSEQPGQSGGPATSSSSQGGYQNSGASGAADALFSSASAPFPDQSAQSSANNQGFEGAHSGDTSS